MKYVLVDSQISQEELIQLRDTLPESCYIVKKNFVDECLDVGGLVDYRDFML